MLFTWKEIPTGYEYHTEDQEVFGAITFRYHKELEPGICDDIVSALLKHPSQAELIEGTIDLPDGELTYTFKKKLTWDKIDTTSTEIKKLDRLTRLRHILTRWASAPWRITSFCTRFARAFREALRRTRE